MGASPLETAGFRSVWLATLAANTGMWMQNVAAAWLMTSLTASPALVALVQTAISLPFFVVAIPAGALADVVDRRRLLLGAQAWMLAVALTLGVLAQQQALEPWSLLALTFALGTGAALATPASQALTPALVAREQLPAAVMLNSAGFNVARAVGPALGGLAIATAGASLPFYLNAAAFAALIAVLFFLRVKPAAGSMPPEHLAGAMRAGLRFTRHARPLRVVLVRTGLCLTCAAALWALLPLIARDRLGLGSAGYGVMLGCFGGGAVAGSALLQSLRTRFGTDAVVAGSSLSFAAVMAAAAFVASPVVAGLAFVFGGVAWIGLMSSFNTAAQLTAPSWVRARALSSYLLVSQGALAFGSAAWGFTASRAGADYTLLAAAALLALTVLAIRRYPLDAVMTVDLSSAAPVHAPEVAGAVEAHEGPVLVSVRYRLKPESAAGFRAAMDDVRGIRMRDGAYAWGLFRDLDDDAVFVESFLVESWEEHLRQHDRATAGDEDVASRVKTFLDGAPSVSHLLDAGDPRH